MDKRYSQFRNIILALTSEHNTCILFLKMEYNMFKIFLNLRMLYSNYKNKMDVLIYKNIQLKSFPSAKIFLKLKLFYTSSLSRE